MSKRWVLIGSLLLMLLGTGSAAAQGNEEGGCVYNRQIYPEGYEMCQAGTQKRCDEGAWEDIGFCDGDEDPPPRSGGGDTVVDPRY